MTIVSNPHGSPQLVGVVLFPCVQQSDAGVLEVTTQLTLQVLKQILQIIEQGVNTQHTLSVVYSIHTSQILTTQM